MMSKCACLFAGAAISAMVQIGTAKAREGIDLGEQAGPSSGFVTCQQAIGRLAAERLRDICIGVSPATHPACGIRNSCALIKDEIARACAIIGDQSAARPSACKVQPSSTVAAVDVLQRYYEAIDAHDYATAYAMLKPDGGKKQTFEAFRQGYAATRSARVSPGRPGEIEGAAGSSYVTVPVDVMTTLDNGREQHFRGSYVLRRMNGSGTSSSADQQWHVFSEQLE